MFGLGVYLMLTRRHAIAMVVGLELMLAAANLNIGVFAAKFQLIPMFKSAANEGVILFLCSLAIAACETGLIMAFLIPLVKRFGTANMDQLSKTVLD